MSYEKSLELKIVRTKHVVTFYDNSCAIDISSDLKQVPAEAKLIDFQTTEEGHHIMVFEMEKEVNT